MWPLPRGGGGLRSWWKHEQQTVRMALSAAVHHSFDKVAAGEKYDGRGRQKTDRAGTRPGVLVTVGHVAAPGPLFCTPLLADTVADTLDAPTVNSSSRSRFPRRRRGRRRRRTRNGGGGKEDADETRELPSLLATPSGSRSAEQEARITALLHSSAGKEKRKKRRKMKTPQTSSCGVRTRQCGHGRALVLRGFLMCSLPYCSSGRAGRRQWQWYVHGLFFWCCSSRCVPSFGRQAQDARHLGRYEPEGQLSVACAWMLSRSVPFYCRQARVAGNHAPLGPFCSLPVCATTGFLVQSVQMVVQFLDKLFLPSLCYGRCRICWSGQCAALPVETLQVPFLDKVMVITTGAVVQTVQTVWKCRSCRLSSRSSTSPVVAQRRIHMVMVRFPSCRTLGG